MEIKGKVKDVMPLREGTSMMGKPWQVQAFVIETIEQFPKEVCIEIFGEEKVSKFFPLLRIGSTLKVSFDVESRQFNGRWYTSVRAWNIVPETEESSITDDSVF